MGSCRWDAGSEDSAGHVVGPCVGNMSLYWRPQGIPFEDECMFEDCFIAKRQEVLCNNVAAYLDTESTNISNLTNKDGTRESLTPGPTEL